MALTINSLHPIDRALYEDRLTKNCFVYIDRQKFTQKAAEMIPKKELALYMLNSKIRIYTRNKDFYLDKSARSLLNVLLDLGVPPKHLKKHQYNEDESLSLDKTGVILPLINSLEESKIHFEDIKIKDAVLDIVKCYLVYINAKSDVSCGESKPSNFEISDKLNQHGNRLYKAKFILEQGVTGRYHTSSDNLQGWHKSYISSISAEANKILVWVDFNQIDLRVAINLFLRHPMNIEIFDSTPDKYKAIVKAMALQNGTYFDEKEFEHDRDIYKMCALAKLYKSSTNTLAERSGKRQLITYLEKFYNACPRYKEYLEVCDFYIKNQKIQDIILKDYFGFTRIVSKNIDNIISTLINSPVQTTSASIMPIVINAIIDKFLSLGYAEPQITTYLNRHDEMVFMLDKELLKDLWIFKDFQTIYVDDWDPITLKVGIGDYYTEENAEYMAEYEHSWKTKLGKELEYQTVKQQTTRKVATYIPTEKLYLAVCALPINSSNDLINKILTTAGIAENSEELVRCLNATKGKIFVIDVFKGIVRRLPVEVFKGGFLPKMNSTKLLFSSFQFENDCIAIDEIRSLDIVPICEGVTPRVQLLQLLDRYVKDDMKSMKIDKSTYSNFFR